VQPGNTRSLFSHNDPSLSLSEFCAALCCRRASTALAVSWTLRQLLALFGALKDSPAFVTLGERLTQSLLSSRSISSHRSARSSPSRRPVVMATTYTVSNLSPRAASSNVRACSLLRGRISFEAGRGPHSICSVTRNQPIHHGLLGRFVKCDVNMVHGARRMP